MSTATCIQHRPGQHFIALHECYYEIASQPAAAAIIGIYHQSWLNGSRDAAMTIGGLVPLLLGLAAEKVARKCVAALESGGWLEREEIDPEAVRGFLSGKQPQQLEGWGQWGISASDCEWCGTSTAALHLHHYPIPKAKGGQEVVRICANCHAEFHLISDSPAYRATQKLLAWFEQAPSVEVV